MADNKLLQNEGEKPSGKSKGRHYDYSEQEIENIKKCLSCKRKDCTGGAGCFRRERAHK